MITAASMGPRRRCRGRWTMPLDVCRRRRLASMGPRRRCRGSDSGSAERFMMAWIGFNGATTKVSWKWHLAAYADVKQLASASMGPRRRSRGSGGRLTSCRYRARCASMGPRRRCRGSDLHAAQRTVAARSLQWGHDEGVVEVAAVDRRLLLATVPASMGPRRRCRGSASMSDRIPGIAALASMGPRRRCRGSGDRGRAGEPVDTCFNGATTKVSWNGDVAMRHRSE